MLQDMQLIMTMMPYILILILLLIILSKNQETLMFMISKLMVITKVKDFINSELLQPYFRDVSVLKGIYGLNPEIVYESQSDSVYENLSTDFMKPEINLVEELLYKGIPILIYNGQDDLIVQNPGTMKWVDRIHFTQSDEFRRKLFTPWKLNNKVVGAIKSAGLL